MKRKRGRHSPLFVRKIRTLMPIGAEGGIRTHMGLPPPAFEAGASAVPPLRLVYVVLCFEVHGYGERFGFPAGGGYPVPAVVFADHQPAGRLLLVRVLDDPAPAFEGPV